MFVFSALLFFGSLIAAIVFLIQGLRRKGKKRKSLYALGVAFLALVIAPTPPEDKSKTASTPPAQTAPTGTTENLEATDSSQASSQASKPATDANGLSATDRERLQQLAQYHEEGCIRDLAGRYPHLGPTEADVKVVQPVRIVGPQVTMRLSVAGFKFTCASHVRGQDSTMEADNEAAVDRAEAAAAEAANSTPEPVEQAETPAPAVEADASESTSSLPTGMLRIVSNGYFGCTNKDVFSKMVSYAVQGDTEAFRQAMLAALTIEECTAFEAGEIVQLEDTAVFSGMIKVRRRGELSEYWTNLEAAK